MTKVKKQNNKEGERKKHNKNVLKGFHFIKRECPPAHTLKASVDTSGGD
ncbi:MAG: hypothetical protein PHN37_03335 [Candidatus Pacebacteria bacterium]|nr:hypothetical protein [Candidatus Paceibacterota bacterium]